MEGMGLKFTLRIGRRLLMQFKHVWACGWNFWDPQLVQTVLTEGLTCLWLPTHPSTLHSPSSPPTPYNVPSVILQWLRKVLKIQQCKLASRNSYKTLPNRLLQLYRYLAWLQSSTRELQWLEHLKSVFLEIPNVTTWLVFQNQVTYHHSIQVLCI